MKVQTVKQQYLTRLLYLAYNQYKKTYQAPEPNFYLLPASRAGVRERWMNEFLDRMLEDSAQQRRIIQEIDRFHSFVNALDRYNERVNRYTIERDTQGLARTIYDEGVNRLGERYTHAPGRLVYHPTTIHIEVPPQDELTYQRIRQAFDEAFYRFTAGIPTMYPRSQGMATCMTHRTAVGQAIADGLFVDEAARMPGLEELSEERVRSYIANPSGIRGEFFSRSVTELPVPNLPNYPPGQGEGR